MHFQSGCGRIYDSDMKGYVYYDGTSVFITDGEDLSQGTCDLPDEIRRTEIEAERVSVVKCMIVTSEDFDRDVVDKCRTIQFSKVSN